MKRAQVTSLWLALALAGCAVTNAPPIDATGPDTSSSEADASLDAWRTDPSGDAPMPDVPMTDAPARDGGPDAYVCPDLDGDGETDAVCGGTDCDDTNGTLSSTTGPCGTATAIRRCVGGVLTDVECDGDTPYCDARVGECVANACGDGVIHENELCDDVDDVFCQACHQRCGSEAACATGQVCRQAFDDVGRESPVCVDEDPAGAANGTMCGTNDQCRSTYCDESMNRCTSVTSFETCSGPNMWVDPTIDSPSRVPSSGYPTCKYSCLHQDECGAGTSCALGRINGPRYMIATCMDVRTGTTDLGGDCSADADCRSGVCVAARCTLVCREDGDCPGALPHCREVDLTGAPWLASPRPSDWLTSWPTLCVP